MPRIITYDSGAINYVQPEVLGTPVGTSAALFVDKNLNQYTTGTGGISCTDVNGLTLWASISDSDIEQLFIDAGAANPTIVGDAGVLLSPDGLKLIFWMQATSSSHYFMYLGVADINATGDVSPPEIIEYLRMKDEEIVLFTAVACFELAGPGTSLIVMTKDFTNLKTQFWICPSVAQIETGDYKGAHPGVSGVVLGADQGPSYYSRWTDPDSHLMTFGDSSVQSGSVNQSPVGFVAEEKFWMVMPKAWMQNGGSGLAASQGGAFPDGGVFYIPFTHLEYADMIWPVGEVTQSLPETSEALDASGYFSPAPPWTEEYTRLYDGDANDGWLASYCGRPAIFYDGDGFPILLFGIIDGNATYEDDIGTGERVYYAKVRGYRWTGGAFIQFDTAEGIILRDGDLGKSGSNFDSPDSQYICVYDNEIYFQVNQHTAMGGTANDLSWLLHFGRYVEIAPSSGSVYGRTRIVPAQTQAA